ncbi:hypothetical protein [Mitsuaria sp. GD03876]|uniref:hypothetical protein n=1 Tax=Mitsuaria sp. GD03876 TaxID=2975399 RepID=UPI00244C29A3|nr:hypothetical protein [Mitsuaria sp. GD03876]MDH0864598.1 hypothetical protein [Mitsuaria sp. GD03876]
MKRALIRSVALAALTTTLPLAAWAGNAYGKILMTESQAHGLFLYLDVASSGTPTCGTETVGSRRYVIRITTPEGKAMAANALMASATGRQVLITGTGSCPDWGDTESIQWLRVYQQ